VSWSFLVRVASFPYGERPSLLWRSAAVCKLAEGSLLSGNSIGFVQRRGPHGQLLDPVDNEHLRASLPVRRRGDDRRTGPHFPRGFFEHFAGCTQPDVDIALGVGRLKTEKIPAVAGIFVGGVCTEVGEHCNDGPEKSLGPRVLNETMPSPKQQELVQVQVVVTRQERRELDPLHRSIRIKLVRISPVRHTVLSCPRHRVRKEPPGRHILNRWRTRRFRFSGLTPPSRLSRSRAARTGKKSMR